MKVPDQRETIARPVLQFGLVGLGYFGKHYLRLLQDTEGARLVAVASRSSKTLEGYAGVLPESVQKSVEVKTIFENPEIDCVVIATPPSTHFDLACRALRAGKHVLLEKPMTTSLAEAMDLERIVVESGRTFMVGHQYLYNDYIRRLKSEIDRGRIGEVKYLFAENFYFGPIRLDIGCFWETATHDLAIIDFLFDPGELRDASGTSAGIRGREDFVVAELVYKSGLAAAIAVSWFGPEKVRRMTLAGAKGLAVFDDRASIEKLKIYTHAYPELPERDSRASSQFLTLEKTESILLNVVAGEPLRNQLEHFIECVRAGSAPLTGIEHGMRVTRLLDAVSKKIKDA